MKAYKKVALVTEYMLNLGGSDRLIQSILKTFPNADIFTLQYNPSNYLGLENKVYTSFLQNFFFRKIVNRTVSVLTPLAIETLDLTNYDLVISISAGAAKGVITGLKTPHIGIICTPPRHQWDKENNIRGSFLKHLYKLGSDLISTYLRMWDQIAIKRVDHVIAISKFIQKKIFKTYGRISEVIYPAVSDFYLKPPKRKEIKQVKIKYGISKPFALVASRLYDYKRIDVAIVACIETKTELYVVGSGPDEKYLRKIAKGNDNIHFIGSIPDGDVRVMYSLAQCLIFPGVEDFGIVPLEAMAQGCAVIAYNEGGVTETVIDSKTGYLYNSYEQLVLILNNNKWKKLKKKDIIGRPKKFSEKAFSTNLVRSIKRYEKTRK